MIFMIARVFDFDRLVGFRLLDTDTGETKIISYEKLFNALNMGINIENLTIENNKLKGKGGSINRYTIVNISGEQLSKSAIIIISKHDNSYAVADYIGNRRYIREQDLVTYSYTNSIANGKISKSSSGKYFISPIEGEFSNDRGTTVARNATNRKYVLPKIKSTDTIDSEFRHINASEFRKNLERRLSYFNFDYITVKHGITKKSNIRVTEASNEILVLMGSEQRNVGITEVKFNGYKQFLLSCIGDIYLVDDILYIGKSWRSVCKDADYKTLDETVNGSTIIALGQIGLLVIHGNKTIRDDTIKCIPYCKLDSIDSLTNELVKNEITSRILDKSDANYILNTAKNCMYQLNFNIDNETLPIASSVVVSKERPYVDDSQALLRSERLSYTIANSSIDLDNSVVADKYIKQMIIDELLHVFENKEKAYFSHCINPLINVNDTWHTRVINGSYRLSYNTIYVKHIGYYLLYKNKLVDKFENIWISENDIKEIEKYTHYVNINNETITIYISKMKLVFDTQLLISLYKSDIQELKESAHKSTKLNAKLGLVGDNARINEAGYLVEWGTGVKIEQINAIKGIELDDDNSANSICIYIKNNFDIIDKRVARRYSSNTIKEIYSHSTIERYIDRLVQSDYGLGLGITLKNSTHQELDNLISAYLRSKVRYDVVINSEQIRIRPFNKEYDTQFIIKHANKLFGIHIDDYMFNDIADILDGDKIEQSEKVKYLRTCIGAMPIKNKKALKTSVTIFDYILKMICNDKERTDILKGLARYAGNR